MTYSTTAYSQIEGFMNNAEPLLYLTLFLALAFIGFWFLCKDKYKKEKIKKEKKQ